MRRGRDEEVGPKMLGMPTIVTGSRPFFAADSTEVSDRFGEGWARPMQAVDAEMLRHRLGTT
jgi:hypothetical protein